MTEPTVRSAIEPVMNEVARPTEQSGRLRLRSALIGGGLALVGTIIAWVVVGNLIR